MRTTKTNNTSQNSWKNSSGLSLIEIMVTLAIIALLMGLTVGVMGQSDDGKMRDATFRLRTVIRYIYSESVRKKMYYRMVLSFEDGSYYVEAKSEPFLIVREGEEEKQINKKEEKKSLLDEAMEDDEDAEGESSESSDEFVAVEERLAQKHKLPDNIKFMDILVSHLPEKATDGEVEIFFFPSGWVERAVINLSNEEEDTFYSLEVNSLTGKAKVRGEYLEIELSDLNKGEQ